MRMLCFSFQKPKFFIIGFWSRFLGLECFGCAIKLWYKFTPNENALFPRSKVFACFGIQTKPMKCRRIQYSYLSLKCVHDIVHQYFKAWLNAPVFHKWPWTRTSDQNSAIGCDHPAGPAASKKIQYVNVFSSTSIFQSTEYPWMQNLLKYPFFKRDGECAGG